MWKQGWKLFLGLTLILVGFKINNTMNNQNTNKTLVVWMRFKPETTDPLKYDLSVHHVTMRSVFASLVSMYENGKISPQIATSWHSNQDQTTWTVTISTDWKFSNGDLITPEIVLRNFKRLVLVKNRENSKSGLLEYLRGFHEFRSINDELDGIQVDKNNLIFSFIKPMPNFLEKISFGLYSIAHPTQYNNDGVWINKKSELSSGAYVISKWDNENFELELRKNLQGINYENRIHNIKFNFSLQLEEVLKSDLILREKLNNLVDDNDWYYASTLEDSNIVYVKVMKWSQAQTPYADLDARKNLRAAFYKNLEDAGFKADKSFFPLSMKGVKEINGTDYYTRPNLQKKLLTMPPFFKPLKSKNNLNKKDLGEIYKLGFEKMCESIGVTAEYRDYPELESDEEKIYDLQYLGTGINIDDPFEDIKFMFLSKHGINLPDSTGKIKEILKDNFFDVQKVNEELWDQAIIWPIRHYSQGFWVKRSSRVDLSKLNLSMNPIDFQFVSWE